MRFYWLIPEKNYRISLHKTRERDALSSDSFIHAFICIRQHGS